MKPIIVIVHGAWHVPEHYQCFVHELRAHNFEVHLPHLPTSGKLAAQSKFEDDVGLISSLLHDLSQKFHKIIVVAHSYGGAVATQALQGHLESAHGPGQARPNVLHLIYMCAFMLQPGESALSASQPRPDPDPVEPRDDGSCFLSQPPKMLFYADVEHDLAKKSEELLQRHSLAALVGPIDYPAWKYIPTTYLRCTEDNVLFPEWQDKLLQAVQDAGVNVEIETYQASHSPYLSRTTEMVDVVERVAERYKRKH